MFQASRLTSTAVIALATSSLFAAASPAAAQSGDVSGGATQAGQTDSVVQADDIGVSSDASQASDTSVSSQSGDDIIVTARRREERLQDVPVAVSAFNGEALERANIPDIVTLATRVPGLSTTGASGGGENNPVFSIRGQSQAELSTLADPSVSLYINEIPAPRTSGANVTFFDIETVEVLKGPQGTLFGRNTTGGAILIRTRQPVHRFDAAISQTVGSYDTFRTEAFINVPIGDIAALRVAGNLMSRDGYITDVVTGRDIDFQRSQAGRVSLLLAPTDSLTSTFVGSYTRIRGGSTGGFVRFAQNLALFADGLAAQQARDPYHVASGVPPHSDVDVWSLENTTSYELTDNVTIKNIIGYRDLKHDGIEDVDGTADANFTAQKLVDHHQISNELQVQGTFGGLDLILGAFYFREHASDMALSYGAGVGQPLTPDPVIEVPDIRDLFPRYSNTWAKVTNTSYAAFAQGTYEILPKLSLTAGVRYTWDKRATTILNRTFIPALSTTTQSCRFTIDEDNNPATPETRPSIENCAFSASKTFSEPTYNLSLDYRLTNDALIYVAHRHGYRSGGFGARGATQKDLADTFEPETVDDFEIGVKADWRIGDAFLRTNLAAFTADYKNMQRYVITTIFPAPVSTTENAASAKIQGIEFETTFRPWSFLELNGFYSYTDAKFKEYPTAIGDASGQIFPRAPKNQWGLTARVSLPIQEDDGDLSVSLGVRHLDRYDFSDNYAIEVNPDGSINEAAVAFNRAEIVPATTLWNASADWTSVGGSNIDASLFVNNVFDKTWIRPYSSIPSTYVSYSAGEPRTYGLRVRVNFK